MSTTTTLIDPSSLSIEELTELLNKKNATVAKTSAGTTKLSDAKLTPATVQIKKCSFKPTRADQTGCDQDADIFFGTMGYCSKHRRSVQALKAKKNADDAEKEKTVETTHEVVPPLVPGPSTPGPKVGGKEKETPVEDEVISNGDSTSLSPGVEETPVSVPAKAITSGKKKTTAPPTAPKVGVKSGVTTGTVKTPKVVTQTSSAKGVVDLRPTVPTSKPVSVPVQIAKPVEPKKVTKKTIKPNQWGRFEDPDTGIVFDPKSRTAFGVQNHKTGKVESLSEKHIAICKKYKWKYFLLPEAKEGVDLCEECGYEKDECICDVEDANVEDPDIDPDEEEVEDPDLDSGEEDLDNEDEEDTEKEDEDEDEDDVEEDPDPDPDPDPDEDEDLDNEVEDEEAKEEGEEDNGWY
jgi:hypothetical protein